MSMILGLQARFKGLHPLNFLCISKVPKMASNDDVTNQESLQNWKQSWVENTIPFHILEVHPSLERNVEKLTKGRKNLTLFFPLCGKAVDMKWLADQGHKIVGVEISDVAIKAFFQESDMEYTESDLDGVQDGKLFMSKDGKIKIFQCNIFKYKSEFGGKVDGIWDRGALEALDVDQRECYLNIMLSLLNRDGVYFVHCFEYPNGQPDIGPHAITQEEVVEMFGPKFNVEKLDEYFLTEKQLAFHGIDKTQKMQGNLYKITRH